MNMSIFLSEFWRKHKINLLKKEIKDNDLISIHIESILKENYKKYYSDITEL